MSRACEHIDLDRVNLPTAKELPPHYRLLRRVLTPKATIVFEDLCRRLLELRYNLVVVDLHNRAIQLVSTTKGEWPWSEDSGHLCAAVCIDCGVDAVGPYQPVVVFS